MKTELNKILVLNTNSISKNLKYLKWYRKRSYWKRPIYKNLVSKFDDLEGPTPSTRRFIDKPLYITDK